MGVGKASGVQLYRTALNMLWKKYSKVSKPRFLGDGVDRREEGDGATHEPRGDGHGPFASDRRDAVHNGAEGLEDGKNGKEEALVLGRM
jgi:hypothetical protein